MKANEIAMERVLVYAKFRDPLSSALREGKRKRKTIIEACYQTAATLRSFVVHLTVNETLSR